MWKRTTKFRPDQTPEQRAWQAKHERRDDARRIAMCNALQFWRACRIRECKRRHACSGDPHACFARQWEQFPESGKAWFRAVAKARRDGLSTRQAMRQTSAEMAQEGEAAAKLAATAVAPQPSDATADRGEAAPAAPQRESASAGARAGPRVRNL